MHLFSPEIGMMGTSGIVGPCILQAAAAGYSFKLLRNGPCRGRVLRRRRGEQRRLPRRAQPGPHLEAAGAVRLREQPVRHRGPLRLRQRQSRAWPRGARLRHARGSRSTATTSCRSTAVAGEAVARARCGGGPTLHRVQDLPHPRPCGGHGRFHLSHARRRRDLEDALPDRAMRWRDRDSLPGRRRRATRQFDAIDDRGRGRRAPTRASSRKPVRLARRATATQHVYAESSAPRARSTQPAPTCTRRRSTFTKATLEALSEEMARNPRIFVMGEGIGQRGGNFAHDGGAVRPITAPSGSAIRRSASADSSGWPAARR